MIGIVAAAALAAGLLVGLTGIGGVILVPVLTGLAGVPRAGRRPRGVEPVLGVEAARGEAALMARLSPDASAARIWAETQQSLGARARHGRAVNLDPAALVTDMVLRIDETAAQIMAQP